jgi:branched-chain amino acid transport system substrate-binding protein
MDDPRCRLPLRFVTAVLLVALTFTGAGAASSAPDAPYFPDADLLVALLAPFSGHGFGTSASEGVTLAIEQQNAAGGLLGYALTQVTKDTACSPTTAETAAIEVIGDGVKFIIGDLCSVAAIAVSNVANPAGVLQISPSASHPTVTLNPDGTVKPYTFRAIFTDPVQGRAGAQFTAKELGVSKVFVLYDPGDDYGNGLAQSFMDEGGRLGLTLESGTFDGSEPVPDFATPLGQAQAMGAELVYLPTYASLANQAVAEARGMLYDAIFLGPDGWDVPEMDPAVMDGTYITSNYSPENPSPGAVAFRQAFQDRFAHSPDALAALSYDSANLLFAAIAAAGAPDPAVVKDKLAVLRFEGVTGKMVFDRFHNPVKTVIVLKVRDGGVHYYSSVDLLPPIVLLPLVLR